MDPEKSFFEAFASAAKRQRYADLLGSKRGRKKVLDSLDHFHFNNLDPRFCRKLAPREGHTVAIEQMLKRLGAPAVCYVMSSWREIDGREMDLLGALQATVGRGIGTIISCLPGALAYFESEERGEQYICYRVRRASVSTKRP